MSLHYLEMGCCNVSCMENLDFIVINKNNDNYVAKCLTYVDAIPAHI